MRQIVGDRRQVSRDFVGDLPEGELVRPTGSQEECQRHPLHQAADPGYLLPLLSREGISGPESPGPFQEQGHGRTIIPLLGTIRQSQAAQGDDLFAAQRQRRWRSNQQDQIGRRL